MKWLPSVALAALAPALGAVAACANNVITAEHPPFGAKGYAFQFDLRAVYQYASAFVDREGRARSALLSQDQGLFIVRGYVPGWMARASVPYARAEAGAARRRGWGDAVFEAGASREWGETRMRALAYAKTPTGDFDGSKPVNIGSGQWDLGPNLSFTRYLRDKSIDLNVFGQYLFRLRNPESRVTPGNQFSCAVAAAHAVRLGAPMRLGLEARGVFDEPNRRGGAAVGAAKRQVSLGPAGLINLGAVRPGLTLWPTALYDIYNRNGARNVLLYLKVQYNY